MVVDLLITELEVGGAEKCLCHLAVFLKRNQCQVRVICIASPPKRKQLTDQLAQAGVEICFLNADRPRQLLSAAKRLKLLIAGSRPDICQSFLFHANCLAAWVYPKFDVPVVAGIRVAEPNWFRSKLEGFLARKFKFVVCVSDAVRIWAISSLQLKADKVIVIPNGIQLLNRVADQIDRVDGPDANSLRSLIRIPQDQELPPILLFVGRLDLQKGIDRLIEIADQLLDRLPAHVLVLIGEGPLRSAIEARVTSLKHRDRIKLAGWQPNPRNWMDDSQLLLLPARYEGMPNVVLEAMAESLAVATTQAEGIEQLLGDQASTQTAPTFEAWSDLVVQLAGDSQLCKELGIANRIRCESEFELDSQLQKYLDLYRRIVNE